jgi:hypothetical protein
VFVKKNGDGAWYKPSQCLWSSAAEIRGYVTISDQYEELRGFFIIVLGVKTLTLQMVYDELVQTTADAPMDRVKAAVNTFNSLLQSGDDPDEAVDPAASVGNRRDSARPGLDPKRVLSAPVFVVRYPNGGKTLVKGSDVEFAIADRQDLAGYFAGRVTTLDYDLREVRRLMPFFEWVGVEGRCMSASVRQFTSVSGGQQRPITEPMYDVRFKAHAILR